MDNVNEVYRYKNFSLTLKDMDESKGIVTGYFASFGTVDADGDVFEPTAFNKSISDNFKRIKHLENHDPFKPVGKLLTLKPDATGLYYESHVGTHKDGKDFLEKAKSGLITEHSVGFIPTKAGRIKTDTGWRYTDVKLFEGSSMTAWGANEFTPLLGVKGMDVEQCRERMKRVEAFCRNTEASDETVEALLIEVKQLNQLVLELTENGTSPADDAKKPLQGQYTSLIMAKLLTRHINF